MKKILIADDVMVIRTVLRRMLERFEQDWDIMEASQGSTILDAYFEFEPDIILLDVELPEVDGWEILRCIRDIDSQVKVVMVTGNERPEDVLKAIELGADGFVGKPFDMAELADALGVQQREMSLAKSA